LGAFEAGAIPESPDVAFAAFIFDFDVVGIE